MTIDEAIKEQELYLGHSDQWEHSKLDKAMKLGIEALKEIKRLRHRHTINFDNKLPGETEE